MTATVLAAFLRVVDQTHLTGWHGANVFAHPPSHFHVPFPSFFCRHHVVPMERIAIASGRQFVFRAIALSVGRESRDLSFE